jgi:hypothetical protein
MGFCKCAPPALNSQISLTLFVTESTNVGSAGSACGNLVADL